MFVCAIVREMRVVAGHCDMIWHRDTTFNGSWKRFVSTHITVINLFWLRCKCSDIALFVFFRVCETFEKFLCDLLLIVKVIDIKMDGRNYESVAKYIIFWQNSPMAIWSSLCYGFRNCKKFVWPTNIWIQLILIVKKDLFGLIKSKNSNRNPYTMFVFQYNFVLLTI